MATPQTAPTQAGMWVPVCVGFGTDRGVDSATSVFAGIPFCANSFDATVDGVDYQYVALADLMAAVNPGQPDPDTGTGPNRDGYIELVDCGTNSGVPLVDVCVTANSVETFFVPIFGGLGLLLIIAWALRLLRMA